MSNVFYYDSKEFGYPTWLVVEATKQERIDFKKYFIESYNFLSGPDYDHLSEDKRKRCCTSWALMFLDCKKNQ